MSIALINSNSLQIPLADKSVHCIVASPPYWGLRSYSGTAKWIGGSADCDHVEQRRDNPATPGNSSTLGYPAGGGARRIADGNNFHQGAYTKLYDTVCKKCGAQRVDEQLGNEPLHDCASWATGAPPCGACFVCNLRSVFAELWRVLRDDGTVWLNLGSTYASSTSHQSRSRDVPHEHSCGNDGKELRDCQAIDYVCRRLCDEHLADFLSHLRRNSDSSQQPVQSSGPLLQTGHDTGLPGFSSMLPGALPLSAQVSTILQSFAQLRGECSRCDNRASDLSRPHSSFDGSLPSVDTCSPESETRARNPYSALPCAQRQPHNQYTSKFSPVCYSCKHLQCDNVQPYYTTLKPKDDAMIPARVALALQADGWYIRSEIVWAKRNPMPESVRDRCTKAHEMIYMLTKSERYFWDQEAVREPLVRLWGDNNIGTNNRINTGEMNGLVLGREKDPHCGLAKAEPNPSGRNLRTVWELSSESFSGAHYATFPTEIPRRCIKAGTSEFGVCGECGAPRVRVVERVTVREQAEAIRPVKTAPSYIAIHGAGSGYDTKTSGVSVSGNMPKSPKITTTDHRPTCDCNAPTVPAIVLDPFAGSGTTIQVARELGRHGIGLDLSFDYLHDVARARLELDRLDAWQSGIVASGSVDDLPLFGGLDK